MQACCYVASSDFLLRDSTEPFKEQTHLKINYRLKAPRETVLYGRTQPGRPTTLLIQFVKH